MPSPLQPGRHTLAQLALLAAALFGGVATPSHAASGLEVYGLIGFPGAGIGVGLPLASNFGARFDMVGVSRLERTLNEEGIEYKGELQLNRAGLFGDWFPFGGRFRLTGGLTINDMKGDLLAAGDGRVLSIGNASYTLGPNDQLRAKIEVPATTPYLGLGWGHNAASGPGWGFFSDLGVSFGRLKVSARAEGPWASQPAVQADVEREVQALRDTLGDVRVVPQITLGVSYRFR